MDEKENKIFTATIDTSTGIATAKPAAASKPAMSGIEAAVTLTFWLLGLGFLSYGCGLIYDPLRYIVWGIGFLYALRKY